MVIIHFVWNPTNSKSKRLNKGKKSNCWMLHNSFHGTKRKILKQNTTICLMSWDLLRCCSQLKVLSTTPGAITNVFLFVQNFSTFYWQGTLSFYFFFNIINSSLFCPKNTKKIYNYQIVNIFHVSKAFQLLWVRVLRIIEIIFR